MTALKPGCCIGDFPNFLSAIRAIIRVRAVSTHTLRTWNDLGADIFYICVSFIFFLTFIAGYASRAVHDRKVQFFSTIVTFLTFRAKSVPLLLIFKIVKIVILTGLTWPVAFWTRIIQGITVLALWTGPITFGANITIVIVFNLTLPVFSTSRADIRVVKIN